MNDGRHEAASRSRAISTSSSRSPPSATSTSRSRSAPRPTSRTTAVASRASPRSRRSAASSSSPRSCCPRSTTSTARWRPRTRTIRCCRACAWCARNSAPRSARVGIESFSPAGEIFDPALHEAVVHQPVEGARERDRGRGLPARLPPRRSHHPPRASRRRRVARGARHGISSRLLQDARGRQKSDPRGDQEGLPQARAQVPPRPQPRRQGGRGALQGDLPGPRRPRRPRQAQAVRLRHGPLRDRRRPRRRLRRLRQLRLRRLQHGRHPLQPVWRRRTRRWRAPARARRTSARAARRRPGGAGLDHLRPGDLRRADPPVGADARHLPHLPRHRRQARHDPHRLPRLRRPRRRDPGPGHVLDLPALLALRRLRHDHRGPLPDLPRRGRRAHRQAPARQHPRRACATAGASAWPARASPVATAVPPATSTS